MSIALHVRKRRPTVKGGWVYRLKEWPMSTLLTILEFVTAPVAILIGTSFFTLEVQTRHRLRVFSHWISAFAGMTYKRTPTCPVAAQTRSIGFGISLDPLGYRRGYLYFRGRDRDHDRPELHASDVSGERGFSSRPRGEAEGRQG